MTGENSAQTQVQLDASSCEERYRRPYKLLEDRPCLCYWPCCWSTVRMSASDEMMKVLQQIWSKLQGFSQDHPLMQAAFLIMVLFFLTFITMMMIGCLYGRCGCCQGTRNRVSVIWLAHFQSTKHEDQDKDGQQNTAGQNKEQIDEIQCFLLCDSTHYGDYNQPIKVVYRTNTRNNGDDGIQKRFSNVDTINNWEITFLWIVQMLATLQTFPTVLNNTACCK